ncbi:unnamed protein product [Mytilus coruscus]|uniref:Uncharacterized protein n=1 Tax=Mytilus coruscus TaxID=42192 RepID=A0A6J8AJ58_MYTCO|nr:unnamed protein product [Mytilus coruscus]
MLSVRDEVGKKKPASLRNLILLHPETKDFGTIYQLVKRYKNPATETSAIQSTVNQTSNYTDDSQPEEQRSVRTRRKALTAEDILRNLTILNPDFIEENRSTENSLYQQYKTAQIESGTLQWRLQPHIDILCMNDINMNTGTIYDFSYVHMTRTLEGNELHYNCTCKLYATLLQLATLNDNLDAEIYDVNIRCCHIRLFKEVIEPIFVNVFTPESIPQPTKSQEIVIKSLELLDKPVCILPSTLKTKKFTVRDENDTESCNFVHLSKNRLICQSGECQTIYGCSQRKVIYLEETTNICPHLDAMKNNRNLWLVNLDNMEDDDDDEDDDQFNNQPNPDDDDAELNEPVQTDRISQVYLKKAYEIHSWISSLLKTNQLRGWRFQRKHRIMGFSSLSQHPPKQDNDPSFREAIQLRHAIFDGAKDIHRDSTGCFTGQTLVLCPPLPLDNCPCGTGYYSEMFPEGQLSEVRYRPTVYLTNGPARYVVRDRECLAGCPGCLVKYSGDINSLHFCQKKLLLEMKSDGFY